MSKQTFSAELVNPRLRPRCGHCGNTNTLVPNLDGDMGCWQCGFVLIEVPDYIRDAIERYDRGDHRALMPPHYRGVDL